MKKRILRTICMVVMMFLGVINFHAFVFGDSDSGFVLPQYSKKVSLDFKNADLKDVLKAFSKQVSINFLTEQDVDAKGITVVLSDVPVEEALAKILSAYGLLYEYDASNNLILVKNKPKEAPAVFVTRIYQLKFASVPGSAVANVLGSTGAISGGLAATGGKAGGGSADGLVTSVKSIVKGEGSSVTEDPRTNSLIITAPQDSFPNIERLLARLDVPMPMVLIEVEMLDISKSTSEKIGLSWKMGASFSGGQRPIEFPYEAYNEGAIGKTASGLAAPTRGLLTFTNVGALLDFLRNQGDTKSLARPRIMTLDNQPASIRISTDEAIGEETTQETNSSLLKSTAERYTTGVLMTVTPQVSLLTDEITLVVEPKVIDATKTTVFSATGNTYKNPEERGVKSILKVKNGETIILGGLLRSEEMKNVTKLPLLGDIPFLGSLFKSTEVNKTDRELVIFITPRIMGSSDLDSSDQKQVAEGVLKGEQSIFDLRTKSILQEMDRISDK